MNLLVEEWGGNIQSQDISAKTGEGIPELLEKVLLEAEILELKSNPNKNAIGAIQQHEFICIKTQCSSFTGRPPACQSPTSCTSKMLLYRTCCSGTNEYCRGHIEKSSATRSTHFTTRRQRDQMHGFWAGYDQNSHSFEY